MDDHGLFFANSLRQYFMIIILLKLAISVIAFVFNKPHHDSVSCTWKLLKCMLFVYCLLLQVPQDLFVLVLWLLLTYLIAPLLRASKMNQINYFFICNVLARCSYFTLGNSNSFTTVDIQAAYTGLSEHNLAMVALHLFLLMFSGPLLVYSQMTPSSEDTWGGKRSSKYGCILFVLLYRCFTCAVVLICSWFQRFHIMTWTVFSPKVIFEIGWAVFDVVLSLTLTCYDIFL